MKEVNHMADNTSGTQYGDFLGRGSSTNNNNVEGNTARQSSGVDTDLLRDIDDTLKDILYTMGNMSQSAARGSMPGNRRDANKWRPSRRSGKNADRGFADDIRRSSGGMFDKFTDGIEDALLESLGASEFKKNIQNSMTNLAKQLGTTVDELPNELGKELGRQLTASGPGKAIADKIKSASNKMLGGLSEAYKQGQGASGYRDAISKGLKVGRDTVRDIVRGPSTRITPEDGESYVDISTDAEDIRNSSSTSPDASNISDSVNQARNNSEAVNAATQPNNIVNFPGNHSTLNEGAQIAEGAAALGPALTGLASSVAMAAVPIIALTAALFVLDKAFDTLAPAIEGTKKMFQAMGKAANRYQESRKKNLEFEKKRIEADFNTMIQAPFKILEQAAQKLYDAWDNQVQTITATQGYNKADVQDLMSAYAQRLRDEGLTKVVSGADIMDNLSQVLKSGLSGKVAEEFAYLATKLTAAVPTQDFFSYADTYASVAANAIKAGKSQEEAIAYANAEMETFASNVLFASRQLSGGFSSGLKDAQQLFNYAVQIANASKEGDPALISGVLTSVSAITGAIAPDLASSIVEAVVKAATGGNSSEIVALRSLAGINASNTEFLKALAKDPQGIFTELFKNLAKMQNMSNDNFMEVAEGLSSVFGISMDAFARVDFAYLADAISQMNVNNASLDENMQLLISGQTTTTAEQMRMAQINQYMLEEGLAYVLDNEVARSIQQHMWDEQLAREMQEATYAVELQGAALEFLEGLKQTVDNIKNFLNPFSFLKKIGQLTGTKKEADALKADTRQLLELGKVGNGNPQSLYNLTTTGKDLNLVQPIIDLMGGQSAYNAASDARKATFQSLDTLANIWAGPINGLLGASVSDSYKAKSFINSAVVNSGPTSKYAWINVSKSVSSALAATPVNSKGIQYPKQEASSTADLARAKSNAMFEKFLDTMDEAIKDNKTYDEWVETAKLFGIKDLSQALESFGRSEEELKGAFGDQEAKEASEYKHNRELIEDKFWAETTKFALNEQEPWLNFEKLLTDNQATMIEQMQIANAKLVDIHTKEQEFLKEWTNYYVHHTAYSNATLDSYKAADIIKAEKKENGDAVLALANALTDNTIGIKEGFKDPVVQTNVLLAKILIVAEAIMQQNNKTGGLSLPDALSALGLGMTSETV